MKKIILTVALAVTALTASYAQKQDKVHLTPEQKAEKVATNLKTKLALSDEQKTKVYQVEVDRMKKSEEWKKATHEAMKAKSEDRKAFMKANDEKLEQILTADQKKTYEAMREQKKSEMKGHHGHPRRGDKATTATPQS
jgi:protein CpxP